MSSRVLIVGGGVASLEAALALRDLAGDRADVQIFAPRREFVYRPYAVGEPYGTARAAHYDLEDLAERCGAGFHLASVAEVRTEARQLVTHDGEHRDYDYALLAPGAERIWPVPGATTFWGIADEPGVRAILDELRSGRVSSLAFTAPGAETWALPLYELALLARAELSRDGVEPRLTIVTPEESPLGVFGRRAGEQMAELLAARGIEVVTGTRPVRFEAGRLLTVPGDQLETDAAVSLPKLEGRRIRGVRHDPDGFIRIDEHCRVLGRERLFAAGDVTSFPVKQGGIATQQADVVAEAIAAELGAELEPQPFDPVLRAELWTGEGPLYLEGWLEGGHGETSALTDAPPWGPNQGKIVGRYLSGLMTAVGFAAAAGALR